MKEAQVSEQPTNIYRWDDFVAEIRIFRSDEGGRKTPPFNGIRWDFAYSEDDISETGLFCIWPDFFDQNGVSLSTESPLNVDVVIPARMTIANLKLREQIHHNRIKEGVKFFCHEGGNRVAEGVVIKITGLFDSRT